MDSCRILLAGLPTCRILSTAPALCAPRHLLNYAPCMHSCLGGSPWPYFCRMATNPNFFACLDLRPWFTPNPSLKLHHLPLPFTNTVLPTNWISCCSTHKPCFFPVVTIPCELASPSGKYFLIPQSPMPAEIFLILPGPMQVPTPA